MKIKTHRFFKYGLICGLILFVVQCDFRTSSLKRFSKAMDIKIPKNSEIIKDEYQDMLQDFVIIYKIRLSDKSMTELSQSIRNSKYFNSGFIVKDFVTEDMFIKCDDLVAVWVKTENGYIFQNQSKRDFFSAKIDTINCTASFNEAHD